jgi:hypothetical protein
MIDVSFRLRGDYLIDISKTTSDVLINQLRLVIIQNLLFLQLLAFLIVVLIYIFIQCLVVFMNFFLELVILR